MPEGPEVKITARELNRILSGKRLLSINFKKWFNVVNKELAQAISQYDTIIHSVSSKGKQIFIKLVYKDENRNKGLLYINSFLALTGRWNVSKQEDYVARLFYGRERSFPRVLYLTNPGRKARLCFLTKEEYDKKLSSIGPDLLSARNLKKDMWINTIRKRSRKTTQICSILLDQSKFSGIGNYIKSDVLNATGIMPNRTIGSINDNELEKLFDNIMDIMRISYDAGGYTFKDWKSPKGKKGKYKTRIYNKSVDSKGNKVIKATFSDKRISYYTKMQK